MRRFSSRLLELFALARVESLSPPKYYGYTVSGPCLLIDLCIKIARGANPEAARLRKRMPLEEEAI